VKTLDIGPGSPWENGYVETFNGKLRDELLGPEIFDTLPEARGLTERWRRDDNRVRPHSSLGYRPPAPEAILPGPLAPPAGERGPYQRGWHHQRGQVRASPGQTDRRRAWEPAGVSTLTASDVHHILGGAGDRVQHAGA
jgi:hypothetical protein